MANRAKRKGRPWSYSTGEHKRTRVRAFERREKGGLIFLEWREQDERTGERRRVRHALGHSDRDRAKREADELAAAFRREARKPTRAMTLGAVCQLYADEVTPTKGSSKRAHDERCRELFLRFFGKDRKPETLSLRDWQRFIAARRAGEIAPKGAKKAKRDKKLKGTQNAAQDAKPRGVRDRVIAYDLKYLLSVLTWAEHAGDGRGGTLLDRNPLRGLPIPSEASPKRPVLTDEDYGKMCEVAPLLSPYFDLALVLAHETGHRLNSIRQLRWSDVDLEGRIVQWRGETDKESYYHETPLTDEAVAALQRERARVRAIGDALIFPSPKNAQEPISRYVFLDWWERAEKRAGLPHEPRRGWHSLRRQFATELKHAPLADLCALGGWKDSTTVLTCYMKPDEATQRRALDDRRELRATGVS